MDRILRCHSIVLYTRIKQLRLRTGSQVKKRRCRAMLLQSTIRSLERRDSRPMKSCGLGSTGLDSTFQSNIWWFLIRSKHNDLLNYFVHDKRDLSPAYVKKCERFLWSLRNAGLITKPQANTLFKMQATSSKRQAPSKKGLDRA